MDEFRGVWAFSEKRDLMLELLGKGRELADKLQVELTAILMGYDIGDGAGELLGYGADRVYVVDHPLFKNFYTDVYANALTSLVKENKPEIILIGSTKRGKELASRIATRLETGCVPDCIRLDVDEKGRLVMSRVVYGGNALSNEVCRVKPQIATVSARVFEKPAYKKRDGEIVKVGVEPSEPKIEIMETREKELAKAKLEEADVIVAGGRGVEKKENFKILEDLASVLGGQVGNTRPLAEDRKWFPEWIGLSGHTVRPSLYLACGISGVIQHMAGIRDARIIVAINKDPEAPIFEFADYGVVGDFYEVVPAISTALRKLLKSG